MVQFLVGFKFSTADCMGVIWNVTLWAVLDRPNVGLLYTVLSLTDSLSLSLLCCFYPYSYYGFLYRGFTITFRHHIL